MSWNRQEKVGRLNRAIQVVSIYTGVICFLLIAFMGLGGNDNNPDSEATPASLNLKNQTPLIIPANQTVISIYHPDGTVKTIFVGKKPFRVRKIPLRFGEKKQFFSATPSKKED